MASGAGVIYDEITLIYCVENKFNPTSEVQNIENGVFQNAPFANGRFPNGGYSCLWAISVTILETGAKKNGLGQKFTISKKSTVFALSS